MVITHSHTHITSVLCGASDAYNKAWSTKPTYYLYICINRIVAIFAVYSAAKHSMGIRLIAGRIFPSVHGPFYGNTKTHDTMANIRMQSGDLRIGDTLTQHVRNRLGKSYSDWSFYTQKGG